MSEVYEIKYTKGLLVKPIETNEELFHKIYNEIDNKVSEVVVISFNCDHKFKYEYDMVNKIDFLNRMINGYDTRFELPYYEEEIQAINKILSEFNKNDCSKYKQLPPIIKFLSGLVNTNKCTVFNIDTEIKCPSISHLREKYKDFPSKFDLLSEKSSIDDIEEIKKKIEKYYRYQREEILNSNNESSVSKFEKFDSDLEYQFININYFMDPRLKNGNLMPENDANELLYALQNLATNRNKIILLNDNLYICNIILPKFGMIKLYGKSKNQQINIIKEIHNKFNKLPIFKSDKSINEMLRCEFAEYSFLL